MDNQQEDNELGGQKGDIVTRRIRAARQKQKIKQVALANFFGIDRSSYHRMENRGAKLSLEQLEHIAGFLGVPLSDLVSEGPLEVPAALQEAAQLRGRVAELEGWLADKQQLLGAAARQAGQVAEHVEQLLVGYARQIEQGPIHTEAPLARQKPSLTEPAVERFGGNEQTQLLLGESFTGRQLVQLAANLSMQQAPFFLLVVRLIEQSLLPAGSLYARAFVYVHSMEQIHQADLGSLKKRVQPSKSKKYG